MSRRDAEELYWHLGNEIHRLAEEVRSTRPAIATARSWEPRVDLVEEEARFVLKVEIAGVRGEDIQLVYLPDRHSMLIRGHRAEEDYSDGCRTGIHLLEILYGDFQREIRLPDVAIDGNCIRATYRNGILVVMIPKQEARIARRTISRESL